MLKPKIILAEPDRYPENAISLLNTRADVKCGPFDREQLIAEIQSADAMIIRFDHRIDQDILSHANKLRIISCAATGSDHIDLETCREKKIDVQTLKGETEFLRRITATAELTWWHILNQMRKASHAFTHVGDGGWNRDQYVGAQLYGKTLGLLGVGRLGAMAAGYGQAFGMKVLGCDPYADEVCANVEYVDVETLFQRSDIISIHVNLTPETRGLVNRALLNHTKKGAFLVNTARGDLIDEDALLEALESGRLAGVGLDVLAGEGCKPSDWPRSNVIWKHMKNDPRICITPHIGGATTESMNSAEEFMADKLLKSLDTVQEEAGL